MEKLIRPRHPFLTSLLITLFTTLPFASVGATNYYFSNSGSDGSSGGYDSPMQTLAKASSLAYEPGDSLLFRRGDTFAGHLVLNSSGSVSQPITIGSYGEGELPVLTGQVGSEAGGDYQEAILIENQDNITIEHLEIQNERLASRANVEDIDAYGIYILNTGTGILENFVFRNLTIRNVYAAKPILKDEGEDAFNGLEVAGIRFFSTQNQTVGEEKRIQNVLVENCFFTDLQRLGIHIKHGGGRNGVGNDELNSNRDIVIRNNEFQFTGGTCVLPIRTYNCLIENNLFYHPGSDSDLRMPNRGSSVWTWRCINTVIQYNDCISTRGYLDSHGIHIDHENLNTFVQYNYMEDCEGGFVEILGGNVNSVYRFNVSVNDGWRDNPNWKNSNHTIWINEVVPSGEHQCEYTYIYNNTVFVDQDYSTAIDIDAKHTFIYNNIFHAENGDIGGKQVVAKNNDTDLFMRNNLFSGNIDQRFQNWDTNPISGDPGFSAAGSSGKHSYQLTSTSPAIDSGVAHVGPPIPNAGSGIFENLTPYPIVDYYGNPIDLSSGTPNVGACNAKDGSIVPEPAVPASGLSVFPSRLSTQTGNTETLNVLIHPALADTTTLAWSSDNETVATVDSIGNVSVHSDGVALITASTSNGQSDTCYVVAGNATPPMSRFAREWMWKNALDPNQNDLATISPTGNPLLLHYAFDVPPKQSITFKLAEEAGQLVARFSGTRSDISYSADTTADLTQWQITPLSVPDSEGVRTLRSDFSADHPSFFKLAISEN